jgi:D-alanyl-D-alanine carboxypeptidase (penicillin-binding protein 5/6)
VPGPPPAQAVGRRQRASERRPPLPTFFLLIAAVVIVLSAIVGVIAYRYSRDVPALSPAVTFPASLQVPDTAPPLPWPKAGQALVEVDGLGVVGHSGTDAGPQPIASTTKIMTAYLILKDHPLNPGEQGPTVTITGGDVRRYNQAIAQDQSTVGVFEGEELTEYQLLQGMLIASANNFAEILATWDAGSNTEFIADMNLEANRLGMGTTHYDDASGFSARTVSTPADLLVLAKAAMAFPVFAEIVAQQSAELPVVGTVQTTNAILGEAGIIGIKTGETDEAGTCLVFAANVPGAAGDVRIYGVVLGQPDRETAFAVSKALVLATPGRIMNARVVSKGTSVGSYAAPWGGTIEAQAAGDLNIAAWAGTTITTSVALDRIDAPVEAGAKVGTLTAKSGERSASVDLVASGAISAPGFTWRVGSR